MYRPAPYVEDDLARLHALIRAFPFATLARAEGGSVAFAYAPVVLDPGEGPFGGVRFHLARANPFTGRGAGPICVSFRGPDSYVSPDWYESKGRVPTWNYIAVEGKGAAKSLDDTELRALLVDLSAQEEARLLPKDPWRIEKVPDAQLAALLKAITGFRLTFETLEGKFKLSQDKDLSDRAGVIWGLEGLDSSGAQAIATAMRGRGV